MDCLTNLVGLDGCESSSAPYTLNQIGYSKGQLEEFMDDSYPTVDEFFNAIKKTAASMVVSDFFGMIASGSLSKQIVESGIIGKYSEGLKTTTNTGISGVAMRYYGQEEYWKINIDSVRLLLNYTGTIELNLYDLLTGEILQTVSVDVLPNKIATATFDLSVISNLQTKNLFVGYDTTGITAYEAKIKTGCNGCGQSSAYSSSSGYFTGARIESPFTSVTNLDQTAGLSVSYSVECNNDQFVCSIKSVFGVAMLWRTAMAALDYSNDSGGQYSNQKTTNHENNEARYTRAEYNYNNEIAKIIKQTRLPTNKCFACKQKIKVKSILPG